MSCLGCFYHVKDLVADDTVASVLKLFSAEKEKEKEKAGVRSSTRKFRYSGRKGLIE